MHAYYCFDGAGKWRESKFIAFCGYMGEVGALERFTEDWKALLQLRRLPALHMVAAMNWSGPEWRTRANEWGEEKDIKRITLLEEFIDVIRRHPLQAIGYSGDSRLIAAQAADAQRADLMMFVMALEVFISKTAPEDKLGVLFDYEDDIIESCLKFIRKLRLSKPDLRRIKTLCFGADEDHATLQAADMFGYLACKELHRRAFAPDQLPDRLYTRLTEGVPTGIAGVPISQLFDAERVKDMLDSQVAKSKRRQK